MAVEIDFSFPFDGCCNGCLAFNDFCPFGSLNVQSSSASMLGCPWTTCDQVLGGYFMSAVEMATVGLLVATLVMS
jgi:hypothetical protein